MLTHEPCQVEGLGLQHQQLDQIVPVAKEWDGKAKWETEQYVGLSQQSITQKYQEILAQHQQKKKKKTSNYWN